MYEFLVLGLIPGTDVRISLSAWIFFSMVLLAFMSRKRLIFVGNLAQRIWSKRYHVAAIVSLATLSLRRKTHD